MGPWGKKHLPTGARLLPFTVVPCLAKLGNHGWGSNKFDPLGTCTQCGPPTIQWTRNLPMISGLVKHGNGKILIYRCLSHVHACTWSFTGDFSLPWLITKGYSTYIYIYIYIYIQYNIVSSQWYLTISHAPRSTIFVAQAAALQGRLPSIRILASSCRMRLGKQQDRQLIGIQQ